MTETTYNNPMSFAIEKINDKVFLAEIIFYNGDKSDFEAPSMSGNIFVNEKVVAGFDDPTVFELYFNEDKIDKIVADRASKDESVYFDIYLKA